MEIWVVVETCGDKDCDSCLVLKSFVNRIDADVYANIVGFDRDVEVQPSYLE